jgi:hypothetical protein
LRRPAADPTQAYEEPDADPLDAPAAPETPAAGPEVEWPVTAAAQGGEPSGWWVPLPEFTPEASMPMTAADVGSAPASDASEYARPLDGPGDADPFADLPPMAAPVEAPVEVPEEVPLEVAAAAPADAPVGEVDASADASADALGGTVGEPLSAAIREAIGNLVVEVDLSQVEQLIRRALDDERRESVEPLARRLSARIGESLDFPTTSALVEAVSHIVPRPGDLAEAVAADVGALLSETILRRRSGDPGAGLETLHLMAGIEQLQVRLDGLQDQFEKSSVLLQAMGTHLEAGDRRAAFAERITMSVDQEMQRLASRIDEQVTALTANTGSGSELADGVARLTRKLRQSVLQLDRALVRLDEVIEQAGDAPVQRLAAARSDGPAGPVSLRSAAQHPR